MTDNPAQLPRQQFSVSNSDTRQQTRMARLEERVKQLEQGKQLIQIPSFRWDQPSVVSNTTSHTWVIDIPIPSGRSTDPLKTQFADLMIWFRITAYAQGGAASGNVVLTGADTHTWTYSFASAGTGRTLSPVPAAAAAFTYDSNLGSQTGVSTPIIMPYVTSGPWGPTASLTFQVTKTGGAGTGVTLSNGTLYAMMLSTSTT
jgi:hypothetical protein